MKRALIMGFVLGSIAGGAFGTLPVIDASSILETKAVLSQLETQYKTLLDQYQQIKNQYAAMIGHTQIGFFENDTVAEAKREWMAADWQDALNEEAGGNPSRYAELLAEYKNQHENLSDADYEKGASPALAKSYRIQAQTNRVSGVGAAYEFNDINSHLKTLQALGEAIEGDKNPSLKSAIDLNARITLEVGFIEAEELRMQTLLNQQQAELQASQLTAEAEASRFNHAGENHV
ncbi:MAG: hypothetical protein EBX40_02305 [Gammaproteobacteria bacterium]|nr:hypothetical protein [Gammaproteobacteria bacterium]